MQDVLKNLCELNKIEWVIAVPHNIIGPRQIYSDPYRNVVSIFINRMLQGKAPIVYGDGEQKRCYSYIDDCLSCMIPMLDQKDLNKQILEVAFNKKHLTYLETKWLFQLEVLEQPEKYYNDNILGKFFTSDFDI